MPLILKPPIRKWASVGLAACILAACHHETQQGTAAAVHGQPDGGPVPQRQAAEQAASAASPGGGSAAAAGASPGAAAGTTPGPTAATIHLVVGRNDTPDRALRKLQLNLTDLPHPRSMPG